MTALFSVVAYGSCDCGQSVQNNFQQIQQKVESHFEPVEDKLEETSEELDNTISQKEKELELVNNALDNKLKIAVMHEKEIQQLTTIKEHLLAQNDAKINSSKIEIGKAKDSTQNLQADTQENSREPFWKK